MATTLFAGWTPVREDKWQKEAHGVKAEVFKDEVLGLWRWRCNRPGDPDFSEWAHGEETTAPKAMAAASRVLEGQAKK